MKIATAKVHHLQIPMETGGPGWGHQEWNSMDFILLELGTDNGLTGWGEAWWGSGLVSGSAAETVAAMHAQIVPNVAGQEINSIASFTHSLLQDASGDGYGCEPTFVISAVNIALWDILARITHDSENVADFRAGSPGVAGG